MIPTAEEFLEHIEEGGKYTFDWKEIAIGFAKYHVEKALKAAAEQAEIENDWDNQKGNISKDSILNAYPLENIK